MRRAAHLFLTMELDISRAGGSGLAGPVLARPLFHSSKKKKKFLVGFDQCSFTAWQRKSSKYSNNAVTSYSALVTTDHPWYRPQAWESCTAVRV